MLLALLDEGSVMLLCHLEAAVAWPERDAINGHAFIEQLNCECVTEHVGVAALQSAVGSTDVGDSKQQRNCILNGES